MDDDMLSGPMFADTPKMPTPYELHLEQRVAELEAALRRIANTNGAQGVLAVNVARRALKGGA